MCRAAGFARVEVLIGAGCVDAVHPRASLSRKSRNAAGHILREFSLVPPLTPRHFRAVVHASSEITSRELWDHSFPFQLVERKCSVRPLARIENRNQHEIAFLTVVQGALDRQLRTFSQPPAKQTSPRLCDSSHPIVTHSSGELSKLIKPRC